MSIKINALNFPDQLIAISTTFKTVDFNKENDDTSYIEINNSKTRKKTHERTPFTPLYFLYKLIVPVS